MPQFWVIAGPNGAGKTTVADRWLAPRIPVVSPDSIAAGHGLSPIQAGKAAVREYAVTERRCIQGGLTPAYSDHRGRMIRSGVTNGCAG